MTSEDARTVFCGNLADKVTEELLYELFLQVAPLERVRIPNDREGKKSTFGFVTLKHEISVPYVVQLIDGVYLFDKRINVKPRNSGNRSQSPPRNNMREAPMPMLQMGMLPGLDQNQYAFNNVVFNELFQMGNMMQLPGNMHQNFSPDNNRDRHERGDRRRDDYRPYRHENRHNSNSGGRHGGRNNPNNYNNRDSYKPRSHDRGHDRNRRRY